MRNKGHNQGIQLQYILHRPSMIYFFQADHIPWRCHHLSKLLSIGNKPSSRIFSNASETQTIPYAHDQISRTGALHFPQCFLWMKCLMKLLISFKNIYKPWKANDSSWCGRLRAKIGVLEMEVPTNISRSGVGQRQAEGGFHCYLLRQTLFPTTVLSFLTLSFHKLNCDWEILPEETVLWFISIYLSNYHLTWFYSVLVWLIKQWLQLLESQNTLGFE